jgi:hypothetical protein
MMLFSAKLNTPNGFKPPDQTAQFAKTISQTSEFPRNHPANPRAHKTPEPMIRPSRLPIDGVGNRLRSLGSGQGLGQTE